MSSAGSRAASSGSAVSIGCTRTAARFADEALRPAPPVIATTSARRGSAGCPAHKRHGRGSRDHECPHCVVRSGSHKRRRVGGVGPGVAGNIEKMNDIELGGGSLKHILETYVIEHGQWRKHAAKLAKGAGAKTCRALEHALGSEVPAEIAEWLDAEGKGLRDQRDSGWVVGLELDVPDSVQQAIPRSRRCCCSPACFRSGMTRRATERSSPRRRTRWMSRRSIASTTRSADSTTSSANRLLTFSSRRGSTTCILQGDQEGTKSVRGARRQGRSASIGCAVRALAVVVRPARGRAGVRVSGAAREGSAADRLESRASQALYTPAARGLLDARPPVPRQRTGVPGGSEGSRGEQGCVGRGAREVLPGVLRREEKSPIKSLSAPKLAAMREVVAKNALAEQTGRQVVDEGEVRAHDDALKALAKSDRRQDRSDRRVLPRARE